MSDGPFKNSKLPRQWRRFGEAVQNDAVDGEERCARASHAILSDLLTDDAASLISDLQDFANRQQLDLDAASSVESIFDRHIRTPFADLLQKELVFRVSQDVGPEDALSQAMEETVRGHISDARNRFHEECIHAVETGDLEQDQCDRVVDQANSAFDGLVVNDICDAVLAGNKNAFKEATAKKEGLDEGPAL